MFTQDQLAKILVIDIETAPIASTFAELPADMQYLWGKKAITLQKRDGSEATPEELFTERAGIFAEFAKVVCVSVGFLHFKDGKPSFRVKSFFGEDEREILEGCRNMLDSTMRLPGWQLCAHNGKEFDIPFLGRRYLIQQLDLPKVIAETQSAKPWEVRILDTMNMWKFGDFKSYTSLELLCGVLQVPSPKEDMDGSMVAPMYWKEKDYERIARYCEQDVIATAQVLLRFSKMPLVAEEDIHRQA
jgi:hypothetical protein